MKEKCEKPFYAILPISKRLLMGFGNFENKSNNKFVSKKQVTNIYFISNRFDKKKE